MPIEYRPTVNDESGQILAQGIAGAAKINADGQIRSADNLANGISAAGSAFGRGIEKAADVFAENQAMRSANDGTSTALKSAGVGNDAFWDQYAKTKDEAKRSGMLAVANQQFQQDLARQRQVDGMNLQLTRDASRDRADLIRDAQSRAGQTKEIVDPITGEKVTFVWQNNQQVVPLRTGGGSGSGSNPVPQYDQSGNVIGHLVTTNGRQQFVKAATPGGGSVLGVDPQAMKVQQVDQLKSEIAELQKKVDGGNNYRGPDWIPIFGSYNKELEAKKARLKGMLGGEQVPADASGATSPAAGGTPPAGGQGSPGGKFQSAADVKAAMRAGQLSRDQALEILRTQFGL